MWSYDQKIYEAKIIRIEESAGHPYAVVKFLGYGNDENVWMENLMESLGEEARSVQIKYVYTAHCSGH